jgi:hypothetical protein
MSEYTGFAKDTVERALKTFAQTVLSLVSVDAATSVVDVNWLSAAGVGATAAVISLLTSFVSANFGSPGTASLVKEVVVEPVR